MSKVQFPGKGRKGTFPVFVACPKGLEEMLITELRELGIRGLQKRFLGLEGELRLDQVYTIVYGSRLASRVSRPIVEMDGFQSTDEFYKQARAIGWHALIPPNRTFAISATVRDSVLTHSQYAAQLLKDAIVDDSMAMFGTRPSVDRDMPDVALDLRIRGSKATISVLYSTQALFRRGLRIHSVEAPLKENLAHAVLRFADWDRKTPLVDICTGSGTFLIEAALWASQTPPGYCKTFQGFEYLPDYDAGAWKRVREDLDAQIVDLPAGLLTGVDVDRRSLEACYDNLEDAGLVDSVRLELMDFRDYPFEAPAFVVGNLPYGERLGEESELRPVYRGLGAALQAGLPGCQAVLMASNANLETQLGLSAERRMMVDNGDLQVAVTLYGL